ncbi:hypothetical protein CAPTEDRAFT_219608 [Capitella teleta]|uniref:Uncharacterized protein n=1 Tax=Capitella teleta TaxID=283909 RepID=R7V8X8_CAPTE|nr:hypothetical protein CAPTEDRAFT_219608 [Capitella teleta]|eukprot:ELU15029.1 hypothetical protein CAPTEDRAFT_219608 [Capitella teleta]
MPLVNGQLTMVVMANGAAEHCFSSHVGTGSQEQDFVRADRIMVDMSSSVSGQNSVSCTVDVLGKDDEEAGARGNWFLMAVILLVKKVVKWTMGYPAGSNQPEASITMQPQAQPGMQVPMTQAPYVQVMAAEQRWSWCPLVTAVFGVICFWPCGIVALLAATTSYTDHKVKDFSRSNNKRSIAYGFGITAIVFGVICWIVAIAVPIAIAVKVIDNNTDLKRVYYPNY